MSDDLQCHEGLMLPTEAMEKELRRDYVLENKRSRRWVGTLNNYSESELASTALQVAAACKYAIVAKERGETGTPHLQAAFILKSAKTLAAMKKCFGERWHFEVMMGTPDQAIKYCEKEGSVLLNYINL